MELREAYRQRDIESKKIAMKSATMLSSDMKL